MLFVVAGIVNLYLRPLKVKNARYRLQRTALICAAMEGRTEIVKMLIERGADPNLRDFDDRTALEWAKQNEHIETIRILQEEFH